MNIYTFSVKQNPGHERNHLYFELNQPMVELRLYNNPYSYVIKHWTFRTKISLCKILKITEK